MKSRSFFYVAASAAFVAVVLTVVPSFAQDDVVKLKQQVADLQKRIGMLEGQKASAAVQEQWDDPFEQMDRMHEQMDRMFRDTFSQGTAMDQGMLSSQLSFNPNFDITENKDGYRIVFDMAGLDQDKVDIQINAHSITVQGEQNSQKQEKGKNQYVDAQMYNSFIRTIPVPKDADTTKIKTEKQGDKLIINLPKKNVKEVHKS